MWVWYGKSAGNTKENLEKVRGRTRELNEKRARNMTEKQVKKYVKKPVVIEAWQTDKEMVIHTLEGDMIARPGDYIITGVNGEQYPCKEEIFQKTYDEVKE